MAEFPSMPLFTDAYLGDTTHLSTLEHGAYLLLLIVAWRNGGHLPNDDKVLAKYARLTKPQWQRIRSTIMSFFEVEGDNIFQSKQRKTFDAVRQVHQLRSDAGRRGGIAKSLKTDDQPLAGLEQTPSKILASKTKTKVREEREDKSSPKKAGSVAWIEGQPPSPEWIEWAVKELGWPRRNAEREAVKFIDYALAHRRTYASWMAAWRQWCRSPFQSQQTTEQQRRLTV